MGRFRLPPYGAWQLPRGKRADLRRDADRSCVRARALLRPSGRDAVIVVEAAHVRRRFDPRAGGKAVGFAKRDGQIAGRVGRRVAEGHVRSCAVVVALPVGEEFAEMALAARKSSEGHVFVNRIRRRAISSPRLFRALTRL
jgi:hypothetical protein